MTSVQDVYEPLSLYRDEFREKFRENAESFFTELVDKSGVDVGANAATVRDIRAIEAELGGAESAHAAWGWAVGLSILALVGAVIAFVVYAGEGLEDSAGILVALAAGAAGILALLFGVFIPKRREWGSRVADASARLSARKEEAFAQMAPLNALFDWDAPARIIEKTVPRIAFDPFFTQGRLTELHDLFGWSDAFNEGKSVLGAQSGEINGNPFVFGRLLQMNWGARTYSGSREVSWVEMERDSEGKLRQVRRYQTLTAYVTKPIPEYSQDVFLIYGNDAAPNLTFTRNPTSLSSAGNGFFGRMRMKSQIKSLERFSRNLDDQYNYMIMGNREFEALFETRDRSNEVEYRLLFTPLAQKQMLELLRDDSVGYGDDFSFVKAHKINVIRPAHLASSDLDTNPAKFAGYDFEAIKGGFINFCVDYFKATYFALAPLLSIPLYQQTRTHAEIYKDVYSRRASFWEHESLANFLGEARFRHPASVTRNILKTNVSNRNGDVATVSVTAYGYRAEDRTDIVSVQANNGRYYDVSVNWVEYLPVSRTTAIRAAEKEGLTKPDFESARQTSEDWADFFRNFGTSGASAAFRRSIVSF